MRVCSLFSGIGGIDIGFEQAGFDIVWANEFDADAAKTYRHNFGDERLIEADIRSIDSRDIPSFDVLVAGFPCQPFSKMGRQRGFEDPRGTLFFEIVRIAKEKKPQVIFLENVSNLIEHDDGKTFLVVYNALAPLGYSLRYAVMDATEYGNVPQIRTRIFIVAFLDSEKCDRFKFPEKINLDKKLNDILVRSTAHDSAYYYTEESIYFKDLKRIVTDKTALYKIYDSGVSSKAYHICPTLTANMGTFPDRVPIIKDDYGIRKITPYECLALQGFPKEYRFPKIPMASAYKQCGNSVVVPVIRRIAEKIKEVMYSG
jgi:DNA (cytosine-5)-methyltransferase 1